MKSEVPSPLSSSSSSSTRLNLHVSGLHDTIVTANICLMKHPETREPVLIEVVRRV